MTTRTLTQADLMAEARARFGDVPRAWAFQCPNCGDVATIQDFIDAGEPDRAGQECVGRLLGVLARVGKTVKGGRKAGVRGSDWAAYGLFRGPWTILMPADGDRPDRNVYSFPLAEATP